MRTRYLLLVTAVGLLAGGCNWMKEWREREPARDREMTKGPKDASAFTPERLVAYLNGQATRLQSIDYRDASMSVGGSGLMSATLDGHLMCAQPRNFQMMGQGRIAGKVIVGSNDEQFWVYLDVPRDGPAYVYASHTDLEAGRARLPNDIPFDPEWVMQALGMTKLSPPPAVQYTLTPNYGGRRGFKGGSGSPESYTLSWPATTPTKRPVVKEVVFDYNGGGTRPFVKKHVVRDPRTNKVIASAEVKSVELTEDGVAQYPTRVVLRWEEQDFKMDLTMKGARVNQLPRDEQSLREVFRRPVIQGAEPQNLARYADYRSTK